jgi:hypothetical protein
VTAGHEEWLRALGGSLEGSRRGRQRLLAELAEHLEEATAEELAGGLAPGEAETAALRRVGSAGTIAEHWNADVAARRSAARVRVVVLAALVAALAAPVALAQRSGAAQPRPHKQPPAAVRQERGGATTRAN